MAALPKAPSKYNPYKNPKLAKFRRDLVLKNLLDNNFIDNKEFTDLKEKNFFKENKKSIFRRCSILY